MGLCDFRDGWYCGRPHRRIVGGLCHAPTGDKVGLVVVVL